MAPRSDADDLWLDVTMCRVEESRILPRAHTAEGPTSALPQVKHPRVERRSNFFMSFAVIFPGQGTQQAAMGAPWRDDAAFSVIAEAEATLGEPLAHLILDATPDELSRTRNAQLRGPVDLARGMGLHQEQPRHTRRVRRPLSRTGHRDDRVGSTQSPRWCPLCSAPRRTHASSGRRKSRSYGRTDRRDTRTGPGRLRRSSGRMLGRQ